jgi:rRNA-processing protein EBP2
MVKSDAHMERIRQRLLNERAGITRAEAKRREREGKKFGKQVQLEKAREREQNKKEMEERLKGLKRSTSCFGTAPRSSILALTHPTSLERKGAMENAEADDDAFDVAVEDAVSDRPAKRGRSSAPGRGGARGGDRKMPRTARDQKFGLGAAGGRRSKQNTKSSTDDFGGDDGRGRGRGRGGARGGARGARGGRGGGRGGASTRPGKSRRQSAKH